MTYTRENYHDKDMQLDLTDEQIKVRNKIVEKYVPLAKNLANSWSYDEFATADGVADLDAHEILGAALEALVIACGRHVRLCLEGGVDPAINHPTVGYLKSRIEGQIKNAIERNMSLVKGASPSDFVSLDQTTEDEDGEQVPAIELNYGDTPWYQEQEQSEEDFQRELKVRQAISEHLPTIRECMEKLTLKQRYVITAHQNGRTQEHMAEKLGINQKNVHHLLQRAFVALRQQFEEKGLKSDDFFL